MMNNSHAWLKIFLLLCLSVVVVTLPGDQSPAEDAGSLIQPDHHERHGRNLAATVLIPNNGHASTIASKPSQGSSTSSNTSPPPARFLLGIFTIADERARRDLIRSAFAMYNDTRLCSLGSKDGKLPTAPRSECEMMYTFVIGANPKGKTQLVLDATSNIPLLTTPPPGFDVTLEPNNDITFLNIQENMNYGKTPTWFHYATQVMKMFDVDYAIKCDTDTYVMIDLFFDISKTMFPRGRSQTYGGFAVWSYPQRHIYMEGQFYLMSRDLAKLVASASLNHTNNISFVEDADTGLVLMKHRRQPTHLISMEKLRSWKHPLKNASSYIEFMAEDALRIGRPLPEMSLLSVNDPVDHNNKKTK